MPQPFQVYVAATVRQPSLRFDQFAVASSAATAGAGAQNIGASEQDEMHSELDKCLPGE